MKTLALLALLTCCLFLSGCGITLAYEQNGNRFEADVTGVKIPYFGKDK